MQIYSDGTRQVVKREAKQGRKPSGLGRIKAVRLFKESEKMLDELRVACGEYWNENEFIRMAVREKLSNNVYIELVKL